MGSFDRWAHRKIRAAKYAAKKKAQRDAAKAAAAPEPVEEPKSSGWSSLSKSQQWAAQNPIAASYDNDGNPIEQHPMEYWS